MGNAPAELGMRDDKSIVIVLPLREGDDANSIDLRKLERESKGLCEGDVVVNVAIMIGKCVLHFPHPSSHADVLSVLEKMGFDDVVISGNAKHYWPPNPETSVIIN